MSFLAQREVYMHKEEISIGEFFADMSPSIQYIVDINALLGVCGASPIHVHYKTNKIVVTDTYPESIIVGSGNSYINISQIQKIFRTIDSNGKVSYEIVCGRLKDLKTTLVMTNEQEAV